MKALFFVPTKDFGPITMMRIEDHLIALGIRDGMSDETQHEGGFVMFTVETPTKIGHFGVPHVQVANLIVQETPVSSETDLDTVLVPVEEFNKRLRLSNEMEDIKWEPVVLGNSRAVFRFKVGQCKVEIDLYAFRVPGVSVRFDQAVFYRIPTNTSHRGVRLTGPGARSANTQFAVDTFLTFLTAVDLEDVFPAGEEEDESIPFEDIDFPMTRDLAPLREEDRLSLMEDTDA